ncbi:MAG: serine hydrolase domain-containing protein [Planctomycetota bacterium]
MRDPTPLAVALLLLAIAPATPAQQPAEAALPADRIAALDAAFADAARKAGVPGASAAVARGGTVVWRGAFGTRDRGADGEAAQAGSAGDDPAAPVDVHTLFQAASISKPITALAVLRLCADDVLDLDAPLPLQPGAVLLPRADGTGDAPVTLRRLLSHTAGTTVHGFPGYALGAEVPTLADVLAGRGNTEPIEVDLEPGTSHRYSGGGYCVVQRVLEAAREQPFAALMQQLVLGPCDMADSTFALPLPEALVARAAHAHDQDGAPMAAAWYQHPEGAAAGLWTTPADLLRAALAAVAAQDGAEGALLPKDLADDMLSVQPGTEHQGLGWMVRREGTQWMVGHGGANQGFRCDLRLMGRDGDVVGCCVMVNCDRDDAVPAILRSLLGAAMRPADK